MKKLIIVLLSLVAFSGYSQRQIPRGGVSGQVLKIGTDDVSVIWGAAGVGTVTSVGAVGGSGVSVTGSPVTTAGTFTINVTGFVPYSGATSGVDLNAKNLINVDSFQINKDANIHGLRFGLGRAAQGTNMAIGYQTLNANTTGASNLAAGYQALNSNTSGGANVAVGNTALTVNLTGRNNVAVGVNALKYNTASSNTAIGTSSLLSNTSGASNTVAGMLGLWSLTTGTGNTAIGYNSDSSATSLNNSIFVGVGNHGPVSGSGNIIIGNNISGLPISCNNQIRIYNGVGKGLSVNRLGGVGLGTDSAAASSILDLTSTTQGFLMPRMTNTQMNAIASPATGLMVYNTTNGVYNYYNATWNTLGANLSTANLTNQGVRVFTLSDVNSLTFKSGATKFRGFNNTAGSGDKYFSLITLSADSTETFKISNLNSETRITTLATLGFSGSTDIYFPSCSNLEFMNTGGYARFNQGGNGYWFTNGDVNCNVRLNVGSAALGTTTAQAHIFGTGTGTAKQLVVENSGSSVGLEVRENNSVTIGKTALATTATDGFPYIPTCAGVPTGVPTAITGYAPLVIDITNSKMYFYSVTTAAWVPLN